jgi:hypothetical protein
VSVVEFLDLKSSRKRSVGFDHLVIVAVFALSLAVFHASYDPHRGKGSVSDGAAFSVFYLGVAYYFGWLPSIWSASLHRWFGSLVMPVFIALVFAYLYLTFKTYYLQPWATVVCFVAHLGVLIFLSART